MRNRRAAVFFGGLMIMLRAMPLLASPLFGTDTEFPTGPQPWAIAVGDLNRDGIPDLVNTNITGHSVSLLLGAGGGEFGAPTDIAVAPGPFGVAVSDLNADGKLDLVTTSSLGNVVSVRLGNGDGTFGARTDFSSGAYPWHVVVGDLNHDGILDLVVTNTNSFSVSVLLGIGNGTFAARTDYGVGVYPNFSAIGDLNGDGNPDLAVASTSSNVVSILLGNGNGTFNLRTDYATGTYPRSVAMADLNGDGELDVVTANGGYPEPNVGTVSVLMGNGNGTLGTRTDLPTGNNAEWIVIQDLNRNGQLDLVTANESLGTVSVHLGNGNGTFRERTDYAAGTGASSVAVADLNGDGNLDLAVANHYGNSISVILQEPVPVVIGVRDVLNDQGGRVKLMWNASRLDLAPSISIDSYWVLRSAPSTYVQKSVSAGARVQQDPAENAALQTGDFLAVEMNGVTDYWEYIASQPAFHMPAYSYVAATTCDSIAGSNPSTAFMVMARTLGGAQWWFSDPASGYSVDNLPPAQPLAFSGEYLGASTSLHWNRSDASDVAEYRLYRGATADFVPDPASFVVAKSDTGFVDAVPGNHHYKLCAADVHGNLSTFALLSPQYASGVGAMAPRIPMLAQNAPNPFNPRTTIRFELPAAGLVKLSIYDVAGRLVRHLVSNDMPAGDHAVAWDGCDAGGRAMGSGSYLARLEFGGNIETVQMGLVR